MKSINTIYKVGLWGLLLWISGCQMLPDTEAEREEQAAAEQAPAAEGEAAGPAAYVPSPNPYLQDPPSVPDEARQRFSRAKQAMLSGDYGAAENDLHWLTENHPTLSGPWLNLALLYQQTEKTEQADSAFRQAIQVNSKNVDAFNQYGVFLRQQGRFDTAEVIYLRGLEVWPDHAPSQLNLGILYEMYMGRLYEAKERYEQYQKIVPEPDRQVAGWIVDLERRIENQGLEQ